MNRLLRINANQIYTKRIPGGTISGIVLFPLVRILIAALFLAPVIVLHNIFAGYVLNGISEPLNSVFYFIETVVLIILLYVAYLLYTKYIENRKPLEFDTSKWIYEFATGLSLGGGIIIFLVLLFIVSGFYRIEEVNSPFILVTGIFRYGLGAFIEELIFTIIFYRLVEEFAGSIVSIIVTSLLFGFLHLGNDNATILSSLFTTTTHFFLLAPFILTRRIWIIWALHFGWNFFQTGVFGMNNSGMAQGGFITPAISGPDWITGGAYGVEMSCISLIIQIIAGVILLRKAANLKQMVKASWRRKGNRSKEYLLWKTTGDFKDYGKRQE